MNITALIAILETKKILTREEGEKILEFWNNKPQPTLLADAVEQIKEIVEAEIPALKNAATQVKRAVTKGVNEAKATANEIANEAVDTAETIAKEVAEAAAQAGEKPAESDTAKK